MLFVSTGISAALKMAEQTTNVEDLEDGEIESDGEEVNETQNEEKQEDLIANEIQSGDQHVVEGAYYSKSGKKKKSKNHKGNQKFKDKNKKNRKISSPSQEDFAETVEKAIRKVMNKNDDNESHYEDVEERRKSKKRKKYDNKEGLKKRKKQEYSDDVDESEMMCVRGASPVPRNTADGSFQDDDRDSYASDSSHDSRDLNHHPRQKRQRPPRVRKSNKNDRDGRRGSAHPNQDPDGVCLYFMQGKCHKGDDCMYSHDAMPPRKMELCKFYLMDCCAKRDKCLYMHADFPCKYYHTGLPCIYKEECKFAHGRPLTDSIRNILLKHIESAPKEILGDFPRLNREGALKMIQTTQLKLMQQYCESEGQSQNIPSLFDLDIQKPHNNSEVSQINQFSHEKHSKMSPKVRQSRWQNDNSLQNFNSNLTCSNFQNANVLNIKNLTGVLTPRQISDLTKMGIENLDQLGQLTVLQLNSIGISLKQITDIQLNTMSIQKLGLINSNNEQALDSSVSAPKDLDLRVPPSAAIANTAVITPELPDKDIDMRFQPSVTVPNTNKNIDRVQSDYIPPNKDMIDIDQYTKDALKFASKDKENIDISNETFENSHLRTEQLETKDVDHRVLSFPADDTHTLNQPLDVSGKKESDTDIRFLQPEHIFKSPDKRNRRYTTDDDEESNLLIDEKWYSSDEEKGNKKKSPALSPQLMSPPQPHVIEPSAVLRKLGDLSKIDISEEVTKLLNTMKNNMQEPVKKSETDDKSKSRDPRAKRSPEHKTEESTLPKTDTIKVLHKKPPRVSIYECVDGEPTDGRRRTDVDLRQADYKLPIFGDTDLRPGSSGDIDFRLGLPFKAIPNYTPASEIDCSINSHPPIPYKIIPIDIPRPDYTDIRNSTAKSQALVDPRLRKVFRLSIDESNSDSEKPTKPAAPRVDPRRKPKETECINQDQKPPSLDLQVVLQNSNWYKDLSSTHKIFVNQQIATVTAMIKMYQQDKTPGKKLDITSIQSNSVLISIFNSLGVSLGENGEFSYLPKPNESLLKTPGGYNQNSNPFTNMSPSGAMENSMINMPPMGMGHSHGQMNRGMGNMPGYNQPYPDPRGGPAPGLLGIAPNMPHNFNSKYPSQNNFSNMPFNGPNDFGHMDGDPNFHRYPNRGGLRGRGNERWHRGGARARQMYSDRGNWKNDRQ